MIPKALQAFYFGQAGQDLLGVYHPPANRAPRQVGVVLCYPVGQEYIRAHRAFLQMATMLAFAGFHALRFDYFGTGDSLGTCEEGTLQRWVQDIGSAVNQLKRIAETDTICLVGCRLGATLALMARDEQQRIDTMVAWEPVLSGSQYLEESLAIHGRDAEPYAHVRTNRSTRPAELMGFALSSELYRNLTELTYQSIEKKPAETILLLEQEANVHTNPFQRHLQAFGSHTEVKRVEAPSVWIKGDDLTKGLVPVKVLQMIVRWISNIYS